MTCRSVAPAVARRIRSSTGALVLFLWACDSPSQVDNVAVLAIGHVVGQYAPDDSAALGRAWAVAARDSTVVVTDMMGASVHRLTGLQRDRVFGGGGSGPGELTHPRAVRFDGAGGVWVADTRLARVTRFDSVGAYRESLPHPYPVSFAVLPDGIVAIGPSVEEPLVILGPEARRVTWAASPPAVLVRGDVLWHPERIWLDAAGKSSVVLVDNYSMTVWRLELADNRVVGVEEVVLPAWLREHAMQLRDRRQKAIRVPAGRRALLGGFTSFHVTDAGVWLRPLGTILGVQIPREGQPVVVIPTANEEHRGLVDSLLLPNGDILLMYPTEVRVHKLDTAAPENLSARLARARQ